MSLGPWTVVDVSMCGAGAAPKVGYMNGSDGATPLCHLGTFWVPTSTVVALF